jgi:hypothetical protein
MPLGGLATISIPRDPRRKLPEREVEFALSHCPVSIGPSGMVHKGDNSIKGNIRVNAVVAQEFGVPFGQVPVEWVFLTSLPVEGFDDCAKILGFYTKQWAMERWRSMFNTGKRMWTRWWHKCSLEAVYALKGMIAAVIMNAELAAKETPDMSVEERLDEDEWKYLCCSASKVESPPEDPYALGEAIMLIGRLGGSGKKMTKSGFPGPTSMWDGICDFFLPSTAGNEAKRGLARARVCLSMVSSIDGIQGARGNTRQKPELDRPVLEFFRLGIARVLDRVHVKN